MFAVAANQFEKYSGDLVHRLLIDELTSAFATYEFFAVDSQAS